MNFRSVYNRLSGTYDFRHASPATRVIRRKEVPIIRRYASGRTLDVGCGTGFHLPLVKDSIGMDISEGMLKMARAAKTGSPVLQAGAERIPFRGESFDTVLCMFSVLNICDYGKSVEEMKRVLKPGGKAIISVASIWDQDYGSLVEKKRIGLTEEMKAKRFQISGEDVELRLFTKDELIGLFRRHGFSLERFDSAFIHLRPRWGDVTRFTLRERLRLLTEGLRPGDYGCMYFMVFRKD